MVKLCKTLFAITLLLTTSLTLAGTIPNFTATYDVTKAGIALGEMKSVYRIGIDNNYSYSSITKPTGIASWFSSETITEISEGKINNNQHIPETYTYERKGGDKQQSTNITFDYSNKTAKDISNNKTINLQIDSSITDRQIVQVLLMDDMLSGKTELIYQVINKQKIKPYSFKILPEETIETTLGTFKTTPVVRKREGSSRETTLWLAHDLFYLPVKIKQTKDGSSKFEMEIIKLSGIDLPENIDNKPPIEPSI